MSRGPGWVMHKVHVLISDEPMALGTLTAKVFQTGELPTRAEIEATRRAAKRLAELGVAHVEQRRNGTRTRRLYVRRAPSDQERAAQAAARREAHRARAIVERSKC